jgi:RND family efflux transporter MFP subunit
MNLRAAWLAAGSALAVALGAFLLRPAWQGEPEGVAVSYGEVRRVVSGPGTVQSRVPVTVSARITARIVSLHADHGDRVVRGQLLAVLDDRDLAAKVAASDAARATLERNIEAAAAAQAKALADLDLARSKARRDGELHRGGFISASAFEASSLALAAAEAAADNAAATLAARRSEVRGIGAEARYAQAQLSHARLEAPMDALVIQRSLEPGATAMAGAPIFRLVDPRALWIAARIDEAQVAALREGLAATIRLRSGEVHAGRVARISRQSDPATRELEVNVAFDAPPEHFAIDQEAEVRIEAGMVRGPAVPVAALVRRDGAQGVYVLRDGRRTFQPLRIAASDGETAIVAEGLQAGTALAAWTSR